MTMVKVIELIIDYFIKINNKQINFVYEIRNSS